MREIALGVEKDEERLEPERLFEPKAAFASC
jgi:hypothetical protein